MINIHLLRLYTLFLISRYSYFLAFDSSSKTQSFSNQTDDSNNELKRSIRILNAEKRVLIRKLENEEQKTKELISSRDQFWKNQQQIIQKKHEDEIHYKDLEIEKLNSTIVEIDAKLLEFIPDSKDVLDALSKIGQKLRKTPKDHEIDEWIRWSKSILKFFEINEQNIQEIKEAN